MLKKPLFKLLLSTGVVVASIYLAACIYLYRQQGRFIYFPSSVIETTPKAFNLDFQEVWLPVTTADGKVRKSMVGGFPSLQLMLKPYYICMVMV